MLFNNKNWKSMKYKTIVAAFMCCCVVKTQPSLAQTLESPRAEWTKASVILMHTPGEELFNGVIHPEAGLFEDYFDVDLAAKEHQHYIDVLRGCGAEVHTVREVLEQAPREELRLLAEKLLTYDTSHMEPTEGLDEQTEQYRQQVLDKMSQADLVRVILLQPTVELHQTSINTGLEARYVQTPLMNLYFCRDQSISTPAGQIVCRLKSSQRFPEADIIDLCYRQLGYDPVYRIQGEDSRLEGGDYIPFGTIGLLGCGLRTNQGAIDEMLQADVIGHDTLVVVRERWKDQYQMHLDTYFNVIDRDLCTLCFNRYDATSADDINFLTISMYARQPGTKDYHEVEAVEGQAFRDFMEQRGVKFIRVSKEDADHYAGNFLCLEGRHIACVAGQSEAYQQALADEGVTVEWIPLDQLTKGYGAAHCMTQVMRRQAYAGTPVTAIAPGGFVAGTAAVAPLYNLQGQRAAEQPAKGIYVAKGKKVAVE